VVNGQCVINTGEYKFDFTSLSAKQISLTSGQYTYEFTFCQPSPQPCGSPPQSSLCQSYDRYEYSLGLWSQFTGWVATAGGASVTASLTGEFCEGTNRQTNVTFKCVDGAPAILAMEETSTCKYDMLIQVPRAVCSSSTSCCAPPTYTSTRVEIGGAKSVVQRDASTGDWFDGNYQGRGQRLLCSTYYNRCFTYPPSQATCVGSTYRPAPIQCFNSPDWSFVEQQPLSQSVSILQTIWLSNLDGNYVVTMPLGTGSTCVAVSGSAIDTSLGFSLTPDVTLWEVPPICLKQLNGTKKV